VRYIPVAYILAIVLLVILAWVGNIYDFDTRSLFTEEGVRWAITSPVRNLARSPLPQICFILMALGLLTQSGMGELLRRPARRSTAQKSPNRLTLKQRRALQFTAITAILLILFFILLITQQKQILLSPLGTLPGSPLLHAILPIVALFFAVIGIVYGTACGLYNSLSDILSAAAFYFAHIPTYFITHLFAAQLIATIFYLFPNSPIPHLPLQLLYYIPLLLHLIRFHQTR